jgi:filamentous hemagglutinin family protein
MKNIRRNVFKRLKREGFKKFTQFVSAVALASTISLLPANAQNIQIDGMTATNLNVKNNTTTVTTSTIRNNNAFNSFLKFNVANGKIVNMVVPDDCSNLINLVKNERTEIHGILNSIKQGKVGGDIYIINPHGITVGPQGVVNVGSLTAITPTDDFTQNFFDAPGMPNDASVSALLNGTAPINSNAIINVEGRINAIENVTLDTGSVINSGEIYSGAVFQENDIEAGDIINLNTIEDASEIAVNSGEIVIKATQDVVNTGKIVADGGNNVDAGTIDILADNDITLDEGTLISAKGKGENSNAGEINILAQNDATFNAGIIDIRGGDVSGDAGFAEFSAVNAVNLNGGNFRAKVYDGNRGQIVIDPGELVISTNQYSEGADMNFIGYDNIYVNSNIIVSSRDIADPINGNHLTDPSTGDSGNITFQASGNIQLNDSSKILAFAGGVYESGDIEFDAMSFYTSRSTIKGGDITVTGSINAYLHNSEIISDGNVSIAPTAYLSFEYSSIEATGSLLMTGNILNNGLTFKPAAGTINVGSLDPATFFQQNTDFNINSNSGVYIGNLDHIFVGGAPLNPTNIDIEAWGVELAGDISTPGNLTATSTNGYVDVDGGAKITVGGDLTFDAYDDIYVRSNSSIDVTGNVYMESGYDVYLYSDTSVVAGNGLEIYAGDDIYINNRNSLDVTGDATFDAGYGVFLSNDASVVATGNVDMIADCHLQFNTNTYVEGYDILLDTERISSHSGSTFKAHNDLGMLPSDNLFIDQSKLYADGGLFLSKGDDDFAPFRFYPQEVEAGFLFSDFMAPDDSIVLWGTNRNFYLGNLDKVTIGGSPLNIEDITMMTTTGYTILAGENSVSGDIFLASGNDSEILANSKITAGGDITIFSSDNQAYIADNAQVSAGGTVEVVANTAARIQEGATVIADGSINLYSDTSSVTVAQNAYLDAGLNIEIITGSNSVNILNNATLIADNNIYIDSSNSTLFGSNTVFDAGNDIQVISRYLGAYDYYNYDNQFFAGNDIYLETENNLNVGRNAYLEAGRNIDLVSLSDNINVGYGYAYGATLTAGQDLTIDADSSFYAYQDSEFFAGNNISVDANYVDIRPGVLFDADNNVTITPVQGLVFDNASIRAGNELGLYSDYVNYGVIFKPAAGTVEANSLDSNFLTPGGAIDLDATTMGGWYTIWLANLDHVIINGSPLNPTDITIHSKHDIYLSGDITATGNINLKSDDSYVAIEANSDIFAGGNLILDASTGASAEIRNNAYVEVGGDLLMATGTGGCGTEISNGAVVDVTGNIDLLSAQYLYLYDAWIGSGGTFNIEANNNVDIYGTEMVSGGAFTASASGSIYTTNGAEVYSDHSITMSSINNSVFIQNSSWLDSAGDVSLFADNGTAQLNESNIISGGNITMDAVMVEVRDGSLLDAEGNVVLNPSGGLVVRDASIIADGTLEIYKGDNIGTNGIEFVPSAGTVEAGSLVSDFLFQDGPIDLTSNNTVAVGNLDYVFIGGQPLNPSSITLTSTGYSARLEGKSSTTGDINIAGKVNTGIREYADVYAGGDINITQTSGSYSNFTSGIFYRAAVEAEGDINMSSTSGPVSIGSDAVVTAGGNINYLNSNGYDQVVQDNATIIAGNNVYFNAPSSAVYNHGGSEIYANNVIVDNANRYYSYGATLNVSGNIDINATSQIYVGNNSYFDASGDISLDSNSIGIYDNAYFEGANVAINPVNYLEMNGGRIYTPGELNITSGNIDDYGIHFVPYAGTIEAGTLNSDFLVDNDHLTVSSSNSSVTIGNLDYIFIGGAPLNPLSISIDGRSAYLAGKNTTTGAIDILATNGTAQINSNADIYAGDGIIMNSLSGPLRIESNATVEAATDFLADSLSGPLFLNTSSKVITGGDISMLANSIQTNSGILLDAGNSIVLEAMTGSLSIETDSQLEADTFIYLLSGSNSSWVQIYERTSLTAGTDILIDAPDTTVGLFGNSLLDAAGDIDILAKRMDFNQNYQIEAGGDVTIDPTSYLKIAGGSLHADGQLNIYGGDIAGQGIWFDAGTGSIEAGSLDSDFLFQNGDLDITSIDDIYIANLDHVTIGGAALNPSNIYLTAGDNVYLRGDTSTTGDIELSAGYRVEISNYSNIYAGGNISIDSGNETRIQYSYVEAAGNMLIEGNYVELYYIYGDNGLKAENITINPSDKLYAYNIEMDVTNQLEINSGNDLSQNFVFRVYPGTITTGSLVSNFLAHNGAIDIERSGTIDIANLDHIFVGGEQFNPTSITLTSTGSDVYLRGDNSTTGDINLNANYQARIDSANVYAGGDINLITSSNSGYVYSTIINSIVEAEGDINLIANTTYYQAQAYIHTSDVTAHNNLLLDSSAPSYAYSQIQNNSIVHADNDITLQTQGNYSYARIQDYSDVTADGTILFDSMNSSQSRPEIYNSTVGAGVDVIFDSSGSTSTNYANVYNSDVYAYRDIIFTPGSGTSYIDVSSSSDLDASQNIQMEADYINIYSYSNLFAGNNILIDPARRLYFYDSGIYANNQLTLNSGNVYDYGITFRPDTGSVEANTLVSDFLAPDSQIELISNNTIDVGNLDYVFIGGQALNPTGLWLESINGSVYLRGYNTIAGNIDLTAKYSAQIYDAYNVYATGDINIYSSNSDAGIQYSTVTAEGDLTMTGHATSIYQSNVNARNVIIDPTNWLNVDYSNINAENEVTINKGNSSYSLTFVPYSVTAQSLSSDFLLQNDALLINNQNSVTIGNLANISIDGQTYSPAYIDIMGTSVYMRGDVVSDGDINLTATSGNAEIYSNSFIESAGTIGIYGYYNSYVQNSASLVAEEDIILENSYNSGGYQVNVKNNATLTAGRDIIFNPANYSQVRINSNAILDAGRNVEFNANEQAGWGYGYVNLEGSKIYAGDTVSFSGTAFYSNGDLIDANNVIIDPSHYLYVNGIDIYATDTLVLNGGDYLNRGIVFRPSAGTIETENLVSDFMGLNQPFEIQSSETISVSNLDHIFVGGQPLNPGSITLYSESSVTLGGDSSSSGDITLISDGSHAYIEYNSNIYSDSDINLTGKYAFIDGGATVRAQGDINLLGYYSFEINDANVHGNNVTLDSGNYSEIYRSTVTADDTIDINGPQVEIADSSLEANNVIINPDDYLDFNYSTITANNVLELYSGDVENRGIRFIPAPGSIHAGTLISDFLFDNEPLELTEISSGCLDSLYIGNLDHIYIGGQQINITGLTLTSNSSITVAGENTIAGDVNISAGNYVDIRDDHLQLLSFSYIRAEGDINIESTGGNTSVFYSELNATGNIDMTGRYVGIRYESNLIAGNDVSLIADGNYLEVNNSSIDAGGTLTLITGDKENHGFRFVPAAGTITANALVSDFLEQDGPVEIITETDIYVELGNLDYIFIGGRPLNPTGIYISSPDGDIEFYGKTTVSGNIEVPIGDYVSFYYDADFTATGDIILSSDYVYLSSGSSISGNNVTLDPNEKLNVNYGSIYAADTLTLNSGDINNRGLRFIPDSGSVEAGSLVSDFLVQDDDLTITSTNSALDIGNLDFITIGGNPLNPANITLNGHYVNIYGQNSTPGDFIVNASGSFNFQDNSVTIAGGNIEARGTGYSSVYIYNDTTLMAEMDIILENPGSSNIYFYDNNLLDAGNDILVNSRRIYMHGSDNKLFADRDIVMTAESSSGTNYLEIYDNNTFDAGRNILLNSGDYIYISDYSEFYASGDFEAQANYISMYDGASVIAENILIDPSNSLYFRNASLNANDLLTLNAGDIYNRGIYFVPEAGTVEAGRLDSNFLTPGGPIDLYSRNNITIGNLDYIFVGGNPLGITDVSLVTTNQSINVYGDNTISGTFLADSGTSTVYINQNTNIHANDIELYGDEVRLYQDSYLYSTNSMIIDPVDYFNIQNGTLRSDNDMTLLGGNSSQYGIIFYPELIETQNLYSDFITPGGPMEFISGSSDYGVYLANLDNIYVGGNPANITDLTVRGYNSVYLGGNINLPGDINIDTKNLRIDQRTFENNRYGDGDSLYYYRNYSVGDISASNMSFKASNEFTLFGMDVNVENHLELNAKGIKNNTFRFVPHEITTGTLSSNFLVQDGPMTFNYHRSEIQIGNLDHVYVGGDQINVTGLNINSGSYNVILSGDNTIHGDINMSGRTVRIYDTVGHMPDGTEIVRNQITADNALFDPQRELSWYNASLDVSGGTLTVKQGNPFDYGLLFVPGQTYANNLVSDFLTQGGPIEFINNGSRSGYVMIGNTDHVYIGGTPLAPSSIILDNLYEAWIIGDVTVPGDLYARADSVYVDTTIGNYFIQPWGGQYSPADLFNSPVESTIRANNVTLDADGFLYVNNVDLQTPGTLTLNTSTADYGLVFAPGSVIAGDLESNFLVPGDDIDIISDGGRRGESIVGIGNLDNVLIGGNGLNIGNMNLINNAGGVYLAGDTSIFGSLTAQGDSVELLEGSKTNAHGPIDLQGSTVTLDGTLGVYNDLFLLVMPDGTIMPFSNIDAAIVNNRVVVDDVIAGGGTIFNIDGNLTGSGTIDLVGADNTIAIINTSLLDTVLNLITVDNRAVSELYINGERTRGDYGDITVNTHGHPIYDVLVENSASDVLLRNDIYNPHGTVEINNLGGSILNNAGSPLISGTDISLFASQGQVGTTNSPIRIDLTNSVLHSYAKNDINITEVDGNLGVGIVESRQGNVNLKALDGNILDARDGEEYNIKAKNITLEAKKGSIGEKADDLNIDTISGVLNALSAKDIFITENAGNLGLGLVKSTAGSVVLKSADGNILDSLKGESANVYGKNITLLALEGEIGKSQDDINIDLRSGNLNAKAKKDIYITENDGDMGLGLVKSANGIVTLAALNGSILDALAGETANIIAKDVSFHTPKGSVGTAQDDINIDLTASTLNALAQSVINISEANGSITIGSVKSTNNNVYLAANSGNITGKNGMVNITGRNVDISANTIDLSFNTSGKTVLDANNNIMMRGTITGLNAVAGGTINGNADFRGITNASARNITLVDTAGDLTIGLVKAPQGTVNLTALKGSILSAPGDSLNIIGRNINLDAFKDIGQQNDYLRAQLGGILIANYNGQMFLIVNGQIYGQQFSDPEIIAEVGSIFRTNDDFVFQHEYNLQDPENVSGMYKVGDDIAIFLADASMFTEEEYLHVLIFILDTAFNEYNDAIASGLTEEEALEVAINILINANIDPETAEEILKKGLISMSAQYVKLLEALSKR